MRNQLFALIALGMASSAVVAQSPTLPDGRNPATPADSAAYSSGASEFAKLDSDGDGTLSKKEGTRNKTVKKEWSKLDSNKDGKLDAMEFSQLELAPADSGSSMTR